jgi:hypothetical protein
MQRSMDFLHSLVLLSWFSPLFLLSRRVLKRCLSLDWERCLYYILRQRYEVTVSTFDSQLSDHAFLHKNLSQILQLVREVSAHFNHRVFLCSPLRTILNTRRQLLMVPTLDIHMRSYLGIAYRYTCRVLVYTCTRQASSSDTTRACVSLRHITPHTDLSKHVPGPPPKTTYTFSRNYPTPALRDRNACIKTRRNHKTRYSPWAGPAQPLHQHNVPAQRVGAGPSERTRSRAEVFAVRCAGSSGPRRGVCVPDAMRHGLRSVDGSMSALQCRYIVDTVCSL